MLHHERMDIDALKMCSLGNLVLIRKDHKVLEYIPAIDSEIYARIPNMNQLYKRELQRKHLTKRRRRGIKR